MFHNKWVSLISAISLVLLIVSCSPGISVYPGVILPDIPVADSELRFIALGDAGSANIDPGGNQQLVADDLAARANSFTP